MKSRLLLVVSLFFCAMSVAADRKKNNSMAAAALRSYSLPEISADKFQRNFKYEQLKKEVKAFELAASKKFLDELQRTYSGNDYFTLGAALLALSEDYDEKKAKEKEKKRFLLVKSQCLYNTATRLYLDEFCNARPEDDKFGGQLDRFVYTRRTVFEKAEVAIERAAEYGRWYIKIELKGNKTRYTIPQERLKICKRLREVGAIVESEEEILAERETKMLRRPCSELNFK